MTLFATLVCIAVLFTVGYFLFAVLGEVAFWLYNRLTTDRLESRISIVQ
jgi:uncharacterized membrane protein YciS (DUF1049 family)